MRVFSFFPLKKYKGYRDTGCATFFYPLKEYKGKDPTRCIFSLTRDKTAKGTGAAIIPFVSLLLQGKGHK